MKKRAKLHLHFRNSGHVVLLLRGRVVFKGRDLDSAANFASGFYGCPCKVTDLPWHNEKFEAYMAARYRKLA